MIEQWVLGGDSQLLPKPDRSATGNSLELDTQIIGYERKCKCKYSLSKCE